MLARDLGQGLPARQLGLELRRRQAEVRGGGSEVAEGSGVPEGAALPAEERRGLARLDPRLQRVRLRLREAAGGDVRVDLVGECLLEGIVERGRGNAELLRGVVKDRLAPFARRIEPVGRDRTAHAEHGQTGHGPDDELPLERPLHRSLPFSGDEL